MINSRSLQNTLAEYFYGAIISILSLGAMIWWGPSAHAIDNLGIDGQNGTLLVHGALTESACRLDMTSAYQDVDLGEIGTARLQKVGHQGDPVHFEIRLEDCLRSSSGKSDERTNGITWSPEQPAVRVTFTSTHDVNNPQLIKARGVSGMGLRMMDERGKDVRLGSGGQPLLLTPGQNVLHYTVRPERTADSLVPGAYHSVVNFYFLYD